MSSGVLRTELVRPTFPFLSLFEELKKEKAAKQRSIRDTPENMKINAKQISRLKIAFLSNLWVQFH